MAATATRESKTGAATPETPKRRGRPPGSKNKTTGGSTNGATRKPRATKQFKIYASDGGDQLAYLLTTKEKNGPAAIHSVVESGLAAPDIKFVALELDDLTPYEIEASINYAVKPLGARPGKRRGRPPKSETAAVAPAAVAPAAAVAAPKAATGAKRGPKPGAKFNKDGSPRKKPGPRTGSTRSASSPATKAALPTPPVVVAPSSPAAAGNPFAD